MRFVLFFPPFLCFFLLLGDLKRNGRGPLLEPFPPEFPNPAPSEHCSLLGSANSTSSLLRTYTYLLVMEQVGTTLLPPAGMCKSTRQVV